MKLRIDTSKAAAALGITRPVRCEQTRLNPHCASWADYHDADNLTASAVSPSDPGLIYWDPYAIFVLEDKGIDTLENSVAHELVHSAQIITLGAEEADRLYHHESEVKGYENNMFEVEARRLSPRLAPLVKVTVE